MQVSIADIIEAFPNYRVALVAADGLTIAPQRPAALDGVATCTHLIVLYFMHEARRDLVVQVSRHSGRRGTFALRSPVRPNPIAASVVKLIATDGRWLSVVGLDCLDGTPLLDLKPYFASTDAVPDAVVGWHGRR